MEIKNGSRVYQVGEKVAEDAKYRLYMCSQEDTGRQCLLQVATEAEYNGELDRAAYILGELKRCSDELEAEYAKVKTDPKDTLNYDLGFPELVDSFSNEDGRRINILAFRNVEDVSKMVPIINITEKDRLRVNLRTSAWIMGKLLKMLVFAHNERFSVGSTTGKNILIEPEQHYVVVFDWSASQIHSGTIPKETRQQEISQAAEAVIKVLGGDPEAGFIPDDGEEAFERYSSHLLRLARGSESNAERVFVRFYELIDSLWKREFYPFTTKPLGKEEDDYGKR